MKLLAQTDSVSLGISEPYGVEDAIRSLVDSYVALKALLINDDDLATNKAAYAGEGRWRALQLTTKCIDVSSLTLQLNIDPTGAIAHKSAEAIALRQAPDMRTKANTLNNTVDR